MIMEKFKSLNEIPAAQLQPGQYLFFASLQNLQKGVIDGGLLKKIRDKEGSPILTVSSRGERVILKGDIQISPEG